MKRFLIKKEATYDGETIDEAIYKFKTDVVNGIGLLIQEKEIPPKRRYFCLGCKGTLSPNVSQKDSWKCPHCGSIEYDYGVEEIEDN